MDELASIAVGASAAGATCLRSTTPSVSPFARAARTYSSSPASTICPNMTRRHIPASGSPSTIHGTISAPSQPRRRVAELDVAQRDPDPERDTPMSAPKNSSAISPTT